MGIFSSRTAVITTIVVLVIASPSYAQSPPQGFFSIGAAVSDGGPNLFVSGGVEKRVAGILSVGADAGMMFDPEQYVLSALVGALGRRQAGFQPFLMTGVSVVSDPDCCGPSAGWNLGGGTNYWWSDRFGIRFSARAALAFGGEGGVAMSTIGIVFR